MTETIRIPLPDGTILNAFYWATEDTLLELVGSQKESNKLFREMAKSQGISKDILDKISSDNKKTSDLTADIEESNKKTNGILGKFISVLDVYTYGQKDIVNAVERSARTISRNINDTVKAVFGGDLQGFARAAGNIVGLGGAAGAAVGVIQSFAHGITNIADTGAGFGMSLTELRNMSAAAGMGLEEFGNMVKSNTQSLKALGIGTQDSMITFANLSNEIYNQQLDAGNFGMNRTDLNEVILAEIELRRLSGQSAVEIQNALSSGMSKLLYETTAMADLTGQDRREMLRNKTTAANDPLIGSILASIDTQFGAKASESLLGITELGGMLGDAGSNIMQEIIKSIGSGLPSNELLELENFGGAEMGQLITDVRGLVESNFATMDSGQLNIEILKLVQSRLSQLDDDSNILQSQSYVGSEVATKLLSMTNALRGVLNSTTDIDQFMSDKKTAIDSEVTKVAGMPAALETALNNFNASIIQTLEELTKSISTVDADGISVAATGITQALQIIGENFDDIALFDGLKDTWGDMNTELQATVVGLVSFQAMISAVSLGVAGIALWKSIANLRPPIVPPGGRPPPPLPPGGGPPPLPPPGGPPPPGRFGKIGNLLGKAALPISLALGAGSGMMDDDYNEYGYVERAGLGIMESAVSTLDMLLSLGDLNRLAMNFADDIMGTTHTDELLSAPINMQAMFKNLVAGTNYDTGMGPMLNPIFRDSMSSKLTPTIEEMKSNPTSTLSPVPAPLIQGNGNSQKPSPETADMMKTFLQMETHLRKISRTVAEQD